MPASAQPVRSPQDDEEYRRDYSAFEYVHALYALDHGWTGQGASVGVVDDGVVATAELAGRISPLSRDFGRVTTSTGTADRDVIGDSFSDHGTLTAAVIAASNDGLGTQGIAPDATIVALRVSDTDEVAGTETLGRTLPAAVDYAASAGIKVLNVSLAKVDASEPSPVWSAMVERYTAAGGLIVNAAGNDAEANVKGYLDLTPANRDGWIFAVAVEENASGVAIADYSNRCGTIAMDRCVAGMGTSVTTDAQGRVVRFSGTSAATPQVSGLAALILSKWPQLTGVEAGKVILATARDLGAPGVDPIYGHGLIDVEAALAPVAPKLSNGVAETTIASSAMVIPGPFAGGEAGTAIRAMLSDVTVLDAFGRDYRGSLAGLVAEPARRPDAFARRFEAGANAGSSHLQGNGIVADFSYATRRIGPSADAIRARMTSSAVATRWGDVRLSAGYQTVDAIQDEAMGMAPTSDASLAYAPQAAFSFEMERHGLSIRMLAGASDGASTQGVALGWRRAGWRLKSGLISEQGAVFGTPTGAGALRFGNGAYTVYGEIAREWRVLDWAVQGYASVGATRLDVSRDTLLTSASTILTRRAGVTASHAIFGGRVRLGIAMPLSVLAGSGTITYANGYDLAARSLLFVNRRVELGGSLDPTLSLGFEKVGTGSALRLAAATDVSGDDVRALASWRVALP